MTIATPHRAPLPGRRLFARIAEWRRIEAARRELSRLSDRELEDLGLARGDIDIVVRGGRPA